VTEKTPDQKRIEELEEKVQRLEYMFDRVGVRLGRGIDVGSTTWVINNYQIATWVNGTQLPLGDDSQYVRMYEGMLEIRGGRIDIATANSGARMTMTALGMTTYNSGGVKTFDLDFTTGNLVMIGTITASAGSIGGWTITSDSIYKSTAGIGINISSAVPAIYVGDLTGDVGTVNIVIDGSAGTIGTSSVQSGYKGWRVNQNGDAEFNNITARGAFSTSIFKYGTIMATNGSIWVVPSCGVTLSKVTSVDGPAEFYISIKDAEGITHAVSGSLWTVGDRIRIKEPLVGDLWGIISAVSDQTSYWRLTATKSSPGAGTNYVFSTGATVLNFGASGKGSIRLTADETNSPYISIGTHAGSPWSAITERARLGKLDGIGALTGYGLWTDNGYFTGEIHASSGSIDGTLTMGASGAITVGTQLVINATGLRLINATAEDSTIARTRMIVLDSTTEYVGGSLYSHWAGGSNNMNTWLINNRPVGAPWATNQLILAALDTIDSKDTRITLNAQAQTISLGATVTAYDSTHGLTMAAGGIFSVDHVAERSSGHTIAHDNLISLKAVATITASTTHSQAGATVLTGQYNDILTCASASDCVKLPAAPVGTWIIIHNQGAANLAVWPPASGRVHYQLADAVSDLLIAPDKYGFFVNADGTYWMQIPMG
jgi:hypothetical protein